MTILGEGYVSANGTPFPDPGNIALMEGLAPPATNPEYAWYGGGYDDDDSGTIEYLSLRYGGQVIGPANELNGISLGGIGRGTDMSFIEIMNNVDDGIEIWGGTVNLKNVSIWNVGDDSLDLDQGWRGKAQFGLIVQGLSSIGSQGSGVSDRCFEVDGAEANDHQPVVTSVLYNFTAIGLPGVGRQGLLTRDNAHVQVRNSIFMDLGGELVANGGGYGPPPDFPTYVDCWSTPHTHTFTSMLLNAFPGAPTTISQAEAYQAQVDGTLLELSDSVFFRNQSATAYATSNTVGVTPGDAINNNVLVTSIADADAPIRSLVRQAPQFTPAGAVFPVATLDPRADNEATTSVGTAPNDGFFTPAGYRGAFSPTENWLKGWSAADAFGFLTFETTATVVNAPGNAQNTLLSSGDGPGYGFLVQDPDGACGITPGSDLYVIIHSIGAPPALGIPSPGNGCNGGVGTILIDFFGTPILSGPLVRSGIFTGSNPVSFPVPANGNLCGLALTSQVAFVNLFTLDTTLGNGLDQVIGG